jgi:signal transduction histidine kinase
MVPFPRRFFGWRQAPSLAFAAVVVLAYAYALWEGAMDLTSPRGMLCLALGFVYTALGAIDFALLCDPAGALRSALYLCTQGCILFAILWTSRLSADMVFCAYPLVAASVALLAPMAATAGVVLLYGMILAIEGHFYGVHSLVRWSAEMLPAFGFVVIFTRIAVKEKTARARAESLSAEIGKLAVIHERNRLAREIHDSLGHYLTTIHVQLEAARAVHETDPGRALEAVAKAQGLAREALVEVRRSVDALQADCVQAPLAERLRDLALTADGWGASVSFEVLGAARALPPLAEHSLFRAVQEGLTNVRKHAKATIAQVMLDYRDPGRVAVVIADDGCGSGTGPAGRGLAGIRERIAALGGTVVAEDAPSGGFRLQLQIPS